MFDVDGDNVLYVDRDKALTKFISNEKYTPLSDVSDKSTYIKNLIEVLMVDTP